MARGLALIVDDSSTARMILARVLEKIDVRSTGVSTAEAALLQLQEADERPDVIFLDHLLPGMDGFQTLAELKRSPETRDIPVFMYTSQGAERYIQEARDLGAAGVIGKQIDREQLYTRLSGILARQYRDIEEASQSAATTTLKSEPGTAAGAPTVVSDADARQLRRFTGRLSTLEIAYEEANDELRHVRQEVARLGVEYSALQRQNRSLRWLGGLVLTGLCILGVVQMVQMGAVNESLAGIQAQFRDIEAVVSALVDLSE